MMRLLLVLVILCVSQKSHTLTHSKAAINEEYNHVVGIEIGGKDESGHWLLSFCVATVLSERLLVTAGHCVADAEIFSNLKVNVRLGKYFSIVKPDGTVIRIGYKTDLHLRDEPMQVLLAPKAKEGLRRKGTGFQFSPGEDFAMILLQNPLPLADHNITPAILATRAQSAQYVRNPSVVPTLVATVNLIAENSTDYRRVAGLNKYSMSGGNTWIESNSLSRIEPGDSGAPVFMLLPNGERRLIAVSKGRGENIFWNWDAYPIVGGRLCDLGKATNLEPRELHLLCD